MAVVNIGGQPYDSFEAVAAADLYLAADVLRAPIWAAAADADAKGRALVSATRMIMALPWAVVPAPAPADADIPAAVEQATAMLAADVLAKPKLVLDGSGNSNVKVAKAGSASVEFFRPVETRPPLSLDIWALLVAAGLVGPVSGDATEVPYVSGACGDQRPLGGRWPDWSCASGDYD